MLVKRQRVPSRVAVEEAGECLKSPNIVLALGREIAAYVGEVLGIGWLRKHAKVSGWLLMDSLPGPIAMVC